jgi:hypothetical protein
VTSEIAPDALRAIVREMLAEVVDRTAARPNAGPGADVRVVTLVDDASLARFVEEVLELGATAQGREAIRSGRVRFRLGDGRGPAAPGRDPAVAAERGVVTIERGALTERSVIAAAKVGHSIVLGRGAVATPLAIERARSLRVEIRKESS